MWSKEEQIKMLKQLDRRYSHNEITENQYRSMRDSIINEKADTSKRPTEYSKKQVITRPLHISRMVLILFSMLVVAYLAYTLPYTTKPIIATYNVSQEIFAQGPALYQFTTPSPQCKLECADVFWSNFTVPANAARISLTGAYRSQYPIVLALLTPTQFTSFMSVNASNIFSNSIFLTYNKSATINLQPAPGTYSLAFYYPGNYLDTLTITKTVTLNYTMTRTLTLTIKPLNTTKAK